MTSSEFHQRAGSRAAGIILLRCREAFQQGLPRGLSGCCSLGDANSSAAQSLRHCWRRCSNHTAKRLNRLVGAGRFELPTPCSRSKCATRLRYAPPDLDAGAQRRADECGLYRRRGGGLQASIGSGGGRSFAWAASDVLAAVDVQLGAVDVARLVGAQEIDGLGHFLGLAEALQGDLLLHDLLGARREHGGVDLAR
jgi:hypothetical protein